MVYIMVVIGRLASETTIKTSCCFEKQLSSSHIAFRKESRWSRYLITMALIVYSRSKDDLGMIISGMHVKVSKTFYNRVYCLPIKNK